MSTNPPPAHETPDLNADRMLVAILRKICAERQIDLQTFSDDWILLLSKGGKTTHVVGYDFELNSATAKMLCKDKNATSELLGRHGIPRIEHRIFHGPQLKGYVPDRGNWRQMLAFFETHRRDIVCKPNEGTGGSGVTRVRSEPELELAVMEIFQRSRSLSLSPYEEIESEYRVAILGETVHFVYRKERPALLGDGKSTLRELLARRLAAAKNFRAELKAAAQLAETEIAPGALDQIPALDAPVTLNWRHNLAGGSAPALIEPGSAQAAPIIDLALQAMRALGVTLASADVVATPAGLKILEINSGIMMENLARKFTFGHDLAHAFYDRIVCRALGINEN